VRGPGPLALAALLAALVIGLAVVSLLVGPAGLGPAQGLGALILGDGGPATLVMREIRLPRTLLAMLVGGGLGLTGAAMQGYLRNPLADPGLLGVSGAAALGAVLAIQSGLAAALWLGLPVAALVGAAASVGLVLLLAGPRGGSLTLILAGIAVSAFAAALTALVLNLSPNPFAAQEIVFWMMGSLADRSWSHVALALPPALLGGAILLRLARALDALSLGEEAAASLGVRLGRVRLGLVAGAALVVGAVTAVAGAIGFVGLVVPHVLRPWVAARPGMLLWASALGGAALVLAADIAVRLVLPERDLKLGVLTALVGAPVFLHLIWRNRRAEA
jgi:iron complex transport system permease protein